MQLAAIAIVAVLFAVFAGYPVAIILIARMVPDRVAPAAVPPPSISILICAYNEAAVLAAKLRSVIAATSAWPGAAEILVADDGSSDATAAIVAGFGDCGVRLVRLARGGKAAALNRLATLAVGEIFVFTDADPLFDAETLPAVIAPLADPDVGAVAGKVETIRHAARAAGRFAAFDMAYRRYESAVRAAENRLFGCVSADGGLFAIRAALMPVVVPDATDDFYISTAAVAAGQRIAFAAMARVHEESIGGSRQNWRRRVRITVRGMTALWRRRALMNPRRTGCYAVGLILHKLARRVAPLLLLPLWVLAALLTLRGVLIWAPVFLMLSGLAVLGTVGALRPAWLPRRLAPGYGAALHLAGLGAGVLLFLAGRRYAQWTPQKQAAVA
ncbi:MAG TPA: glycosyltransferase [Sphingomonas sp.]|jgi:cellulose synthase/poly-beta-1,6-N-acetylglucosamine synthase-like glycosyltransferase|uniref:glycosyltransferase n=1 Tax=Sphingomonas sp. TaxID=28214 RepID=UPI002EDA0F03